MKKTTLATAVLALMLLGSAALAEAPSEDEKAENAVQEQTEETEMKEENGEDNDFLNWIGEGAGMLSDALSDGWDKAKDAVQAGFGMASDAVQEGMEWMKEKIADWTENAEAYMEKKQWDKKVEEAWETLKTGAQKTGEVAAEKVTEAYHTVRDWLLESDEAVDQEVAEAVDRVAEYAGVAEAKMSGWYRRMESYMTEKADLVTDSVREAWEIIRRSAVDAGSVAAEKVSQAFETVRQWLESLGETEDAEIVEQLVEMEEAAHS